MTIIRQLFEVILRKREPSDVNYSINAMVVICLLTAVSQFYQISSIKGLSQPALYAVILTVAQIMAYSLLLKLHNKEGRLVQTLTLVLGISLIMFVILILISHIPNLSILSLAIWGYSIILTIHILKSSFSCPTYLAVVILISVSVFSFLMLFIVAPSSYEEYKLLIEQLQASAEQQQSH